ncbi:hypothetical protein WG906_18025 [Pedobacter sp. P351]|uniref:hypothetical protein n=1 Tax=Pedobacter superstes TaxID=3133441 RepID=UPI0030B16B04
MENLLPFLAGLAYMAYKIYENYQKGQEEARKRNPSQPYSDVEEETYQEWKGEDIYVPTKSILDKEVPPEKYHEPKYERMIETPYREPVRKEAKATIPSVVELFNPEEPAEEVVKNREIHAPHRHKFVASQEEVDLSSDFDFRDAIIKEAVLNRPQY